MIPFLIKVLKHSFVPGLTIIMRKYAKIPLLKIKISYTTEQSGEKKNEAM